MLVIKLARTIQHQLRLAAALGGLIFMNPAFAGQSIQLSTQMVVNNSVPVQPVSAPWRVEFSIHDWDANATQSRPLDADVVGVDIVLLHVGNGDLRLQLYSRTAVNVGICQIAGLGPSGPGGGGTLYTTRFITVRFQQDPVNLVDHCQAWDINGNKVYDQDYPFQSVTGANTAGAYVTGSGQNLSTAYFRVYTCTVSASARPPVTADTTSCLLLWWKFDGNLNDSSGHGYNGQLSGGSATYVPTPGQGLVVPILQTFNPPPWGNFVSFRAGFPNQLDGRASYSQADSTPNVSCFWQVVSSPSTVPLIANFFDNRNSCTPTVQGLVFGNYSIELVATDANGRQATITQDVGAVATDSNGVVVNANPLVDALFGPMIAWGRNPWGYQDYWSMHATTLRSADYASPVISQGQSYPGWSTNGKPQWETPGQGTVSYYFDCVGGSLCVGPPINLAAAITPTSATVTLQDATRIDTSELPTRIQIYDGSNWDELRVCSVMGNTLVLCYDPSPLPRHSFANGTNVLQSKVTGSSTRFLSDANAAVCPLGPGLPGVATNSAGTASLTAGSNVMTGSGTNWALGTGVVAGDFVQVTASHSGMAFTFVAQIQTVTDTTHLTLARPFPADADTAAGLTYAVMPATRTIVLRYPHAFDPSGEGQLMFGTTGCETEDAVYLSPFTFGLGNSFSPGHDIPALEGKHFTGELYSITDTSGWINEGSTGGINFYGEDLAHWALYFRSGLNVALNAARAIGSYWIRSPWGNADGNGNPRLFLGAGGVGGFVSKLVDPSSAVSWSDLRGYANLGVSMVNGVAANGCNSYDDTRDTGWAYAWLILAAIYDPDTASTAAPGGISWRTYWQNALATMQSDDSMCERADHSWSNGFLWNRNIGPFTLTQGSTAVTGTNIATSVCAGTTTGTATVTNGSAAINAVSGSFPANSTVLVITGTMNGNPFTGSYLYNGSGLSASLSVLWPGDSGSVTWMASNVDPGNPNNALTAFATSNDDLTDLSHNYACIWNSPTSITLDHAWAGATGSAYYVATGSLAGYGQQPFMLGIKALSMQFLARQTLPELASYAASYTQFTKDASQWIHDVGYDSNNQGLSYGRVFQFCEPSTVAAGVFTSRTPGCNFGVSPDAYVVARELNGEVGTAASLYFDYNQSPANQLWGDTVYGALWGYCPWTTGGVYCDSKAPAANVGASNLLDSYIHAGKWTGFFAGAGMSHRWPADRLGGVQPPMYRTVSVSFPSNAMTGAASVQIVITAPSGAQTVTQCSGPPCQVTVDDRQGTHLYQIQYLSASAQVISQSDPDLLK